MVDHGGRASLFILAGDRGGLDALQDVGTEGVDHPGRTDKPRAAMKGEKNAVSICLRSRVN